MVRAKEYEIAHIEHNENIHFSTWTDDGRTPKLLFPVKSLTPFRNYDIRVLPYNGVTSGYNQTVNQWTKLNPIENFKPIKLTPNQITLKWDDVEHAVYYRVFYTCELCENVTRQDTDYAGIQISDLEETTLYNVTIEPVAENDVPGRVTRRFLKRNLKYHPQTGSVLEIY